jgi:hypothetical protein
MKIYGGVESQAPVKRFKPTRKLTPAERRWQICAQCGKRFPMYEAETSQFQPIDDTGPESFVHARSTSVALMDRAGYFCKLRCAAEFGVAKCRDSARKQSPYGRLR